MSDIKLIIITPCSRPENLDKLYKSIHFENCNLYASFNNNFILFFQ